MIIPYRLYNLRPFKIIQAFCMLIHLNNLIVGLYWRDISNFTILRLLDFLFLIVQRFHKLRTSINRLIIYFRHILFSAVKYLQNEEEVVIRYIEEED